MENGRIIINNKVWEKERDDDHVIGTNQDKLITLVIKPILEYYPDDNENHPHGKFLPEYNSNFLHSEVILLKS